MKRKDYQEPTMTIVKLQKHCYLLAGSQEGNGGSLPGRQEAEDF